MKLAALALTALLAASSARALPVMSMEAADMAAMGGKGDYQIGDEWGKKPVTAASLQNASPEFIRAARAAAKVSIRMMRNGHPSLGTSFYLGKFNGHHMMATNYHVLSPESMGQSVSFPLLGKSFALEKIYGRWSDIELALFSIKVKSPEDEALLATVARNFDFGANLPVGSPLVTIGFGIFQNPSFELTGGADSDCKVFSAMSDARFIKDPDELNTADYKVWSFATGCDTSHGDSGSAVVDRNSGAPVGIIWTAGNPKPKGVRSSAFLDQLLQTQGPEVWKGLSYAVPASKIRDFLLDYLNRTRFRDRDALQTLQAVVQ